jgi:membrane-associated phospholipid phosphatase
LERQTQTTFTAAGRAFEQFVGGHKLFVALLAGLIDSGTYLAANHFPRTQPHVLALSALDGAIPFLPFTVWIYVSDWTLVFMGFFLLRGARTSTRFAVSFVSLVLFGALVHWALPAAFPRELFPIPPGTYPLNAMAVGALRSVDSPSSCMPSMHVATSWLVALAVFHERRRPGLAMMVWATAVSIATLTAKQHVIIDVVAGIAVAAVWYVLSYRWAPGREIPVGVRAS